MIRRLLPRLAVCLVATATFAQDLPPICLRGAQGGPVPLEHALTLEAQDYIATHTARVTLPDFDVEAGTDPIDHYQQLVFAQAIEWPGVLADRAAELPASAHDLPWLVMLAYIDTMFGDPVWSLSQGAESALVPHMLPMLDRHGLADEARVLRMVMGLYPTWDADPTQRRVVDANGQVIDETLQAALDAAARSWPAGQGGATAAALRLVNAEPSLRAEFQGRVDAMDDVARLDLLMRTLWDQCISDAWGNPGMGQRFSQMGSAQVALILMDSFSLTAEGTSLYTWFDDSAGGQSELLARLFDRRGLADLAHGLRAGIALFPPPFPRDDYLRWDALAGMDQDTLARFDTLLTADSYDLVRADMLRLARDSGLLP